jgi:hypothetical protein
MRCSMQWATEHVDAVLVARVAGLWDNGDWDAGGVHQVYARASPEHPEAGAAKAGARVESRVTKID